MLSESTTLRCGTAQGVLSYSGIIASLQLFGMYFATSPDLLLARVMYRMRLAFRKHFRRRLGVLHQTNA
jgi:hypothetical protein